MATREYDPDWYTKLKRKSFGPLNQCEHLRMRWHCHDTNGVACGHLECPTCGFFFDDASEGCWGREWENYFRRQR